MDVAVGIEPGVLFGNFALHANYPNPFNPSTTIANILSSASFVSLRIFSVLGQEVATLVNGREGAGAHTVEWNAEGAQGGVYFFRLVTGDFARTKKMVLAK